MTKVVLIGAGSAEFTRKLLADLFSYPALRSLRLALHDIDAERLETAVRLARHLADATGARPSIHGHLDRRAALDGADFVINTVQIGGARATRLDFNVPARYGLRYTINDTINIGGVFRGLRTIPVVTAIARDMERACPDALLLNYTNPMSILVWAISARSAVRTIGLCHSVYWTVRRLAEYLELPFKELEAVSGGINHLAFILRLERRGADLYPAVHRFVRHGELRDDDLVRAELCRRLGYYPTESSEHHAEYSAWFIPKPRMVERFRIPLGEYLRRVDANLRKHDDARRRLDAGEPFPLARSGEYAAQIIHAVVSGTSERVVGNVMNHAALIPNLPAEACVEVPCAVDGSGPAPTAIGPLPAQCAAYIHPAVDAQALTIRAAQERDRDAVYHAVMQDPLIQARLTLDQTWELTDELIRAESEWLPDWLDGRVSDPV